MFFTMFFKTQNIVQTMLIVHPHTMGMISRHYLRAQPGPHLQVHGLQRPPPSGGTQHDLLALHIRGSPQSHSSSPSTRPSPQKASWVALKHEL